MVNRRIKLSEKQSIFLFGPRGVGKSTLLRSRFGAPSGSCLWIDLLKDEDEEIFSRRPDELSNRLASGSYQTVIIDEVQKAPKLLDIVHRESELRKNCRFILSGSSARKLKRTGANLLAGRAISYHLHPFTHSELGGQFRLQDALEWGTLPKVSELDDPEEIRLFLKTYVKTYLKEEIIAEQLIRKVEPFRDFLEIAAQMNGTLLNRAKISRDLGIDDKTVETYLEILEDTLVGFRLKPFHRSIRKRQREASKFYFFDPGVKRALDSTLHVPLVPKTSAYGRAFEHWVILEALRWNDYAQADFRFSYLRTKDDAEIDLILERPGAPDLLVEIKSFERVEEDSLRQLRRFAQAWDSPCEAQLWSNDPHSKKIGEISCYPWYEALKLLSHTPTGSGAS